MAVLTTIPALTVTQPWASLVALGHKHVETRNWQVKVSRYRGPVAIHAAATFPGWCKEYVQEDCFAACLGFAQARDLPLGCVLAIAVLVDCVPTVPYRDTLSAQERAFGNFGPGRFAWIFENIQALPTPIQARGMLNLWSWTPTDPTILAGWA